MVPAKTNTVLLGMEEMEQMTMIFSLEIQLKWTPINTVFQILSFSKINHYDSSRKKERER